MLLFILLSCSGAASSSGEREIEIKPKPYVISRAEELKGISEGDAIRGILEENGLYSSLEMREIGVEIVEDGGQQQVYVKREYLEPVPCRYYEVLPAEETIYDDVLTFRRAIAATIGVEQNVSQVEQKFSADIESENFE